MGEQPQTQATKATAKEQKPRRKYINPGNLPTRVTDNYGLTTTLAPFKDRRIGAFRNVKRFVVELERDFGDRLARTGQISPAPKDIQMEDVDEDPKEKALREAREKAIAEQRKRREAFQAQSEFAGPLDEETQLDRRIERLNTEGDDEDEPPELDLEHATPPVEKVTKGLENLTRPADAEDLKAQISGPDAGRKKKPKGH